MKNNVSVLLGQDQTKNRRFALVFRPLLEALYEKL